MSNKVLIIEDEESIRGFIKINFNMHNFQVIEAESGEKGLMMASSEHPDIVILDVMLPGIDGYQVCESLRREFPDIGIIMLTAKGQDLDKIKGLELGADDYVVKPFNPMELILRAKSLVRRVGEKHDQVQSQNVTYGPFVIDTYSKKAYKNDRELSLTPKEFHLLQLFMENPGKAFSRNALLDTIWGSDFVGDHKIVDVNIRRLRVKIEDKTSKDLFIETVWGTGYRWRKD
ncbi:response regulator transcription factor [Heyndrickxia oleronia]|uniref:DNA-binding response regulator n=1 Tax=Heyndrickxia oleronia TaxID=38875 RepID=A0A8E2LEN9_9BACI|nr:response regulator transcription factor [Heyndrickxia oleronia]NYV63640.1 response regulator transcription factor [Bacillus sp. Gen3]OJH18383.1 DNA-binding response regulator [Bacillus obstructivus]MCI1589962.1 response regulator transcription factor [Heyndrickxia oleronia]MCI1613412.1 response regulator transcription factor [Heyndrickxia oleronia]MCI1744680.1 response regulator transcription factor [Heyndrickxia oleronia]